MNTILLIIATALTAIGFIPLVVFQSYRKRGSGLSTYHFKIAKDLDELWCLLLFGIEDHTVSAVIFKRAYVDENVKYVKYVNAVNKLFHDEFHCSSAYEDEFKKEGSE